MKTNKRKPGIKTRSAPRRRLQRVVRPPVTDLQYVADELDAMATLMWGVAERMEYFGGFGGFKGEMRKHAHELAGAATTARTWAKGIRERRSNVDLSHGDDHNQK